jgi:tetratricopeptide (TPR) repeat protein
MTRSFWSTAALAVSLTFSSSSFAEPTPAPAKAGKPKLGAPDAAGDKQPYLDLIKSGDSAYLARNFDAALTAYRQAVEKEPENALGHYRLGQAQIAKGDLKEAETAYLAGLRHAGSNRALEAKLSFVLADLRERQKSYDEAALAWTKYEALAKKEPTVKSFPQTAAERKKRLTEYKRLVTEYAAVKARIEKRLKEADERSRKSAQ